MIEIRHRNGIKLTLSNDRAEKIGKMKERGIKTVRIDGVLYDTADLFIGKEVKKPNLLQMKRPAILDEPKRKSSNEWPYRARRYFHTKDKRYNDLNISLKDLETEYGREWNG